MALLGEDQLLFSSDYPHGEGRENAAQELKARGDISKGQKQRVCSIIRSGCFERREVID
jgi:predicted TIM-barrel fold metal-dependent hydrolase